MSLKVLLAFASLGLAAEGQSHRACQPPALGAAEPGLGDTRAACAGAGGVTGF